MPPSSAPAGLRERKRAQTRQRIVDAAYRLFSERGFAGTTVADIAASADIAPRTFFGYFPSKESALFPEADDRITLTVAAIASRSPDEGPIDVLLRALADGVGRSDDMTGRMAALRIRLIEDEPTVAGLGAQAQMRAAGEIGQALTASFPTTLTPMQASALAGAFVGASAAAVAMAIATHGSALSDPEQLAAEIRDAVSSVLAP